MTTRITLEILLLLLLIVANGVFAMAEIAVVSSRKARLRTRGEEGDRGAAVALELAEKPDDFLSTVQIGITLVGILAGVFGGATLAEELGASFNRIAWVAPHGEKLGLALVVLAITYLSLVAGELVPKRIALANPERIAATMSPFMRGLARMARPAVWFLSVSTSAVVRLLRIRESNEPAVTEEEVTSMLELGRETGEFHPAEEEMIKGVFALANRTASAIMTPRHEVVWLDLTRPTRELQRYIVESGLSRFPAAEGSLDRFVGVVDVKDLIGRDDGSWLVDAMMNFDDFAGAVGLRIPDAAEHDTVASCFEGQPADLRAAVHEALIFPETTSVLQILHAFRSAGRRSASSSTNTAASKASSRSPTSRCACSASTKTRTRSSARVADRVDANGFRFEIVDMDGRRVDKLLVSKLRESAR